MQNLLSVVPVGINDPAWTERVFDLNAVKGELSPWLFDDNVNFLGNNGQKAAQGPAKGLENRLLALNVVEVAVLQICDGLHGSLVVIVAVAEAMDRESVRKLLQVWQH